MTSAPATSDLDALVHAIETWDHRLESALSIRERTRALPDGLRPRDRSNDKQSRAERAVLMAASGYKKGLGARGAMFDDEALASAMGPYLGDRALRAWPFHDPLHISEQEAVQWLPLVGRHAAPDEAARAFVRIMFRVRQRQVWVPASRAFAALAARDGESFAELSAQWAERYPEGLPARWSGGVLLQSPKKAAPSEPRDGSSDTSGAEELTAHAHHHARHVLHAACAWMALGGDPARLGGVTPEKLAAMALPTNGADRSAVLLALGALAFGAETRAPLLARLPARVAESAPDPQQEDALRAMLEPLSLNVNVDASAGAATALAAVRRALTEPRWKACKGEALPDALWSWVQSAQLFRRRGDDADVGAMLACAEDAAPLLLLSLTGALPGGHTDAVTALFSPLRVLLDADVFATTGERGRAIALLEALALVDREEVKPLPWRSVVARALGRSPPADVARAGSAGAVARADLMLAMVRAHHVPAVLRHTSELDEPVVLELARAPFGHLATNVAIQVERLLRLRPSPEAQVRLLWRLLQAHPPVKTFRELRALLRDDGSPLHAVVSVVATLDVLREDLAERAPCADVARGYQRLAAAAVALLKSGDAETKAAALIEDLAASMAPPEGAVGERHEVGSEAWGAWLSRILVGPDGAPEAGGLEGWIRWLGLPAVDTRPRLDEFVRAVRALRDGDPQSAALRLGDLEQAETQLRAALDRLPWPEEGVVHDAFARVKRWAEGQVRAAKESALIAERVTQWLDRAAERELVAFVRGAPDEELASLPPEHVRRLSLFLLAHLLFGVQRRLRARASGRVQLPNAMGYLTPLLGGVAGGLPFVIDNSAYYNQVVLPEEGARYALVLIGILAVAFALMYGNLAAQIARGKDSIAKRVRRVSGRVLPIFVGVYVLSCTLSLLTLLALGHTDIRRVGSLTLSMETQVPLWGALSLFFGVFINLFVTGASSSRRD